MRILNHARPRYRTLVCNVTGLGLLYVVPARPIPKGKAIMPNGSSVDLLFLEAGKHATVAPTRL